MRYPKIRGKNFFQLSIIKKSYRCRGKVARIQIQKKINIVVIKGIIILKTLKNKIVESALKK